MGTSVRLDDLPHIRKAPRDEAAWHQQTIADILGLQTLRFPGAQPVSFARKHIRELQQTDYFVAEKTDGIRCLLYLTENTIDNDQRIEAQYLIDRKNEYYHVEPGYLHIPPAHKQNPKEPYNIHAWHLATVLDGELVRQRWPNGREQLTYMIFDALALDGENLLPKNLNSRLGRADMVYKPYRKFAQDWPEEAKVQPFQIDMKRPELSYGIEKLFKETIPQLPHINDGLIFTCRSTGYTPNTDPHILKWKPPHENTVDFRLELGSFPIEHDENGEFEDFDAKPQMILKVFGGGRKYDKFAELYVTDEEWEAMKGMNEQLDWRIIECWREANTGRWRPKLDKGVPRFRDDKEHANHESVVHSVLESIEDAVSEEDLIAAAPAIRTAWKKREADEKERQQRMQAEQRQKHEAAKAAQARQQQQRAQEVKQEDDDGPGYVD